MAKKCSKGLRLKSGKCVKKSFFSRSSNKKSYNPFKMWGSWAGLVGYPIMCFLGIKYGVTFLLLPLFFIKIFLGNCNDWGCLGLFAMLLIIFSPIVGFLLGWGIHSLIRRFKRR